MKHCLVIGGNGFIGTSLITALQQDERTITVLDHMMPVHPLPNIKYISADYGKEDVLRKLLSGVDEIVLLAYSSVPKTSFDDPFSDISENLPRALTLFKIASVYKKLVVISSGGAIYGNVDRLPIRETHATNPISPYGITKLAIEKYALMYAASDKLPVVIVRPANAYGEGQRPFTGQGFVATAIASILQRKPIIMYSRTGTIRDYIHVSDLASGIVAALDKGRIGSVYNLGTRVGTTNMEIIDMLRPLANKAKLEIQIDRKPERSFDVAANVLDSRLLRADTGWHVTVPLRPGLRRTWQWFKDI